MYRKQGWDKRKTMQIVSPADLIPQDHLLRKTENAIGFDFIYEEAKKRGSGSLWLFAPRAGSGGTVHSVRAQAQKMLQGAGAMDLVYRGLSREKTALHRRNSLTALRSPLPPDFGRSLGTVFTSGNTA